MPTFRKLRLEGEGGKSSAGKAVGFPALSEMDVMDWVGAKSLQRGRSYARGGHIFNTRRTGQTLKALCHGTQGGPYRLEVTLTQSGLSEGDCSCPVGDEGRCKHVAAMLLLWIDEPDSFGEVEDLESVLAQRTPEQLLALIRQMLIRHPDLESLIELPVPGQDAEKPVKVSLLRNQVRAALAMDGGRWDEEYSDPARELEPVVKLGESYLNAQAWHNAATVFETIAREILEVYYQLYDEEGDVQEVVNRCVSGLGICLKNLDAPVEREPLLNALFYVHQWDIDNGGIDMGYETTEILVNQSRANEKKLLAKWARGAAETGNGWGRQAWGGFLLKLEAETMDDESYLKLCRKMGRTGDLVERLLKLKRAEEAEAEAIQLGDLDMMALLPLFNQHGQVARLLPHMRQHAKETPRSPLVAWLKEYAAQQGDHAEALMWAEQQLWAAPRLDHYEEVKALATKLNRWASLRSAILERLTVLKHHNVLLQVYLSEGEARQALDTLALGRRMVPSLIHSDLPLRVARLAEADYPLEAEEIYLRAVEKFIGERNRQSYATAASYLVRVKALYLKRGQQAEWKEFITELRAKHRTLRALQEELGKAGL